MLELIVASVSVRTDKDGRFCLNDLHRAAGGNASHAPGQWLRNKQAQELVRELGGVEIPTGPVATINDGINNGTFVAKELVYAYAMWISPAFHLKVIRAYDALVTRPAQALAVPQSLPEALRLAADLAEQKAQAEAALAIAAPKAEALDRLTRADGGCCITNAAKDLQIRPKDLFSLLSERKWIYRRTGGSGWLAYQDRLQQGVLEHKVTTVSRSDGTEKVIEQVLVTPKGLAKLAQMLVHDLALEPG